MYKAYLAYKRKELLLDFDDMIHETSRLLERKSELLQRYRERYTHILVDEFQEAVHSLGRLAYAPLSFRLLTAEAI